MFFSINSQSSKKTVRIRGQVERGAGFFGQGRLLKDLSSSISKVA